ncbi:unnamed protein product [Litomosoides sigmodontis]|uniref:Uncharacterized protein n=1 Tax=Litomosoides sigmodontis TaxID=42156 RepID=A0A3P6SE72_LITSI|nr:unnamed protein product [Litomosoides sigmodontis]
MLTYHDSSLSETKNTIGTSSLSSELTDVSFADITVSSQESFDNDNTVLSARTHPNITKLSPTAINILPKNIINLSLSNISPPTATSEAHVYPEALMDARTGRNSKTDNSITRRIQPHNIKKNKSLRKITEKYHETTSKKVFVFSTFPETFRNTGKRCCEDNIIRWLEYMQLEIMRNRGYNFDEMIESIEQEIGVIESICLNKELNTETDRESTAMSEREMFNETLQILNDLIIDM